MLAILKQSTGTKEFFAIGSENRATLGGLLHFVAWLVNADGLVDDFLSIEKGRLEFPSGVFRGLVEIVFGFRVAADSEWDHGFAFDSLRVEFNDADVGVTVKAVTFF